jgi:hypothetical protein
MMRDVYDWDLGAKSRSEKENLKSNFYELELLSYRPTVTSFANKSALHTGRKL